MGNLERSSNQLRDVDSALQRTTAGAFGICINCEGEIGAEAAGCRTMGITLYRLPRAYRIATKTLVKRSGSKWRQAESKPAASRTLFTEHRPNYPEVAPGNVEASS